MNAVRRHAPLATALVVATALVLGLRAQGVDRVAAPPEEPVATAPGWVDVEGGLRRLGVASAGIVGEVLVQEGAVVDSGAVLLRLDDREARIEAGAAEVEVARARREHTALVGALERGKEAAARIAPLVAEQTEPADELRRARAEIAALQSRADLAVLAERAASLKADLARQRLAQQEIRAPSRGAELRIVAHPGDGVSPGTPIVWFAPEGKRIVRAELDERFFGRVRAGMSAEVRPEYDDTQVYAARVLRVAAAVGPVQGLPEVRPAARDDRVVECVLELASQDLLIGQRVLVRLLGSR